MLPKAMVLCMCVVASIYTCEANYREGYDLPNTKKALNYISGYRAGPILKLLRRIRGGAPHIGNEVNTTDFVKEASEPLRSSILKRVGNILTRGWNKVKTFKAPGKIYIMLTPESLVAVADVEKQEAWTLASPRGNSRLSATASWMIYAALNVISRGVGPIMRAIHMDCVTIPEIVTHVGMIIVEDIIMKDVQVCGFASMKPSRNVTITRDEGTLMIVDVPYYIDSLTVNIRATNATGNPMPTLENTPMTWYIKNTQVKVKISFSKGTILKFVKIIIRVEKLGEFDVKVNVDGDDRTVIMDFIEVISDVVSDVLIKTINQQFIQVEQKISSLFTWKG